MIKRFLAALLIVFAINELNASVNTGHAVVSLKSDLVSQNVDNFHLAINFKMDEGWHTYWSNPGDSGGPLVFRKISGDPWYQVGIVSFGTPKCGTGKPGIYTRISGYLDWISRHLEE